jgi:radical SAM superfamily enzyme YgiQ (UPF0313 family)
MGAAQNDVPPGLELMPYGHPFIELGEIRPPSEAYSLLLRVQRNCPWNRCEFCELYKGGEFSVRSVDELKGDIDTSRVFYQEKGLWGLIPTAFLQDANAVVMNTPELAEVIHYLKQEFPSIERVTSHSSSITVYEKPIEDLETLAKAGLSEIRIGMESGSAEVLKYQNKGATPEIHVSAGKKVKEAGISLSEYIIFGLGGQNWTEEHALTSAYVINQINPDFIGSSRLTVSPRAPLYQKVRDGDFVPLREEEIVEEQRRFIDGLEGITSEFVSDPNFNLLAELEGKLPEDKQKLLGIIDRFLRLGEEERKVFIRERVHQLSVN